MSFLQTEVNQIKNSISFKLARNKIRRKVWFDLVPVFRAQFA